MRTARAASMFAVLVLTAGADARAQMIPPGEEDVVRRMLAKNADDDPAWPSGCAPTSIAIENDHIDASGTCGGSTFNFRLRHVAAPGDATFRTATFGVFVQGGAPPPDLLRVLRARIEANEGAFHWVIPAPPPERGPSPPPQRTASPPPPPREGLLGGLIDPSGRPSSTGVAWLLVCASSIVPFALGAAMGAVIRRVRFARAATAGVTVPLMIGALASPFFVGVLRYSVYDLLWVTVATVLGILVTSLPARFDRAWAANVVRVGVTTLITLSALEIGVRRLSIAGPAVPDALLPRVLFEPWNRDFGCEAIYPGAVEGPWFTNLRGPPDIARKQGRRRVMHIGDSMLEAGDVAPGQSFTARLGAAHRDEEHLNLGVSNTGTDAHYAILTRWLERLNPDLVVYHLFPGNDLFEIDRPFVCAASGPLLAYDPAPRLRLPSASWRVSARVLFGRGPAPFALRMLSSRSRAARALTNALERSFRVTDSEREVWEHFTPLVAAIRDETRRSRVPLIAVVLPSRRSVEDAAFRDKGDGHDATTQRMLSTLRAAGIQTFDAIPLFVDALKRDPAARWFRPGPLNPHFDSDGHAVFAEWVSGPIEQALHDRD
jgi:hypothetical protein